MHLQHPALLLRAPLLEPDCPPPLPFALPRLPLTANRTCKAAVPISLGLHAAREEPQPSNVAELVDADARRKLSVALEEVELGTVVGT